MTNGSHRQSLVKSRLSARLPRDTALNKVAQVYRLLPKGFSSPLLVEPGWKEIPEVDINLSSLGSVRITSLNSAFLKKFKGFTLGSTREAAVLKFWEYEDMCKHSNRRIRKFRDGGNPYLQAVILTAQRIISRTLRDFRLDDLLNLSRWGPGSTSSCAGTNVSNPEKFRARPDITREFLSKGRLCMPLLPSWSALLADSEYGSIVCPTMNVIRGNKVTFVPKTAKTDRGIAIEPHLNVFFQCGLGRMIRKQMMRAGVNLDDQTLNQRLARQASITDDLATIDLEGASDTICIELVRDLLPEDWFEWLDASRSHFGNLDGTEFRYHKFSSMGNGATFDLESLIFWSLSKAVCQIEGYNDFWINVFGDDIIVPSGIYEKLSSVFTDLGFKVNAKKSFSQGPFRESCGADWFLGETTRPIYLKDIPTSPKQWMVLCNQIRKLAHSWVPYGCDKRLKPAWDFCLSNVPKDVRYFVPYGFDLKGSVSKGFEGNGILSNFDEACPFAGKLTARGFEGFELKALGVKPQTSRSDSRSIITSGCFEPNLFGNELPLRGMVSDREITLFVPGDWYDLGPWV